MKWVCTEAPRYQLLGSTKAPVPSVTQLAQVVYNLHGGLYRKFLNVSVFKRRIYRDTLNHQILLISDEIGEIKAAI